MVITYRAYCLNCNRFIHEEEDTHLTTFSGHAIVNYGIDVDYYGVTANNTGFKIGVPESGTETLSITGFDTIEDALSSTSGSLQSQVTANNNNTVILTSALASDLTTLSGLVDSIDTELTTTSGNLQSQITSNNNNTIILTSALSNDITTLSGVLQSDVDDRVLRAGDTMTGFLSLSGDPTTSGHAANKHYVDQQITAISGGRIQAYSFANGGLIGSSNTYSTEGWLIWSGSDVAGFPDTIQFLIQTSNTGFVRIVDTGTGLTVCELGPFTNTTAAILTASSLSNITAAAAIWEIQLRKQGGGANTTCFGLNINF